MVVVTRGHRGRCLTRGHRDRCLTRGHPLFD